MITTTVPKQSKKKSSTGLNGTHYIDKISHVTGRREDTGTTTKGLRRKAREPKGESGRVDGSGGPNGLSVLHLGKRSLGGKKRVWGSKERARHAESQGSNAVRREADQWGKGGGNEQTERDADHAEGGSYRRAAVGNKLT